MQVNVMKNELAGALTALGKLVCRTSPMPIRRAMLIESVGNRIAFQTQDSYETITYKIELSEAAPFRVIVDFEAFRIAVRGCRNKFVALSYENGALAVDGAVIPQVDDLWVNELQPPVEALPTVLPENFTDLLAEAAQVVDRTGYRKILQGIHLCPQGIVATNGKAMTHIEFPLQIEPFTLPFPLALLTAKCKGSGLLRNWLDHDDRYFTIQIGNWTWTARALEGIYPNWQSVIPKATTAVVQLSPEAIPQLKELLRPYDKAPEAVHLCGKEKALQVCVADKTLCVNAEFSGEHAFEIRIASDILNKMLRSGLDKISMKDAQTPFVATRSDSSVRMIAMPMFVPAAKTETKPETATQNKEEKVEVKEIKVGEPKAVKPPVQVVGGNANPMQTVLDSIDVMKTKLRDALEATTELGHQVRDAIRANQQRDRNYASMVSLVERIKTAL